MIRLPVKKADARCSCVTDQYECGFCRGPKLRRIWNGMTEKEKAYDLYVAGLSDGDFDSDRSCSCHLIAPCSWCIDQPDPDAEKDETDVATSTCGIGKADETKAILSEGAGE